MTIILMAKRIESYDTFEESSDAQRRLMLSMTPLERLCKLYELSSGFKTEAKPNVFSLYRPKSKTKKQHAQGNS